MPLPQSTRVAKTLYRISGHLSRIKTYTRFYSVEITDTPGGGIDFHSEATGRHWTGWGFAYTVLRWSIRWDYKHWDHWGLIHDTCGWTECSDCNGRICGPYEEEVE